MKEHFFLWAVGLSAIGHATLFILLPSQFHPSERLRPKGSDVEVTYFDIRELPQWGEASDEEAQKEELKGTEAIEIPPAAETVTQEVAEERSQTLEEEALTREMALRMQDPVFLTYYQSIREQIRQSAKQRYHQKLLRGDVSLAFTLFSNGRLKEVHLLQRSLKAAPLLRAIAVQSLMDASPFAPFPEALSHDQISFIVVLTFDPEP